MRTRLTRSWLPLLILVVAGLTAIALAQGSSNGGSSSKGRSAGGNETVTVTKEKVNGQSEQVLTNGQGMTLYYSTKDTAKTSNCSGACAQTWEPLTVSGKPTGPSKIQSDLSTLKRSSGKMQVEYKGNPLYTYSEDRKTGDVKGAGKSSFTVATVSVKAAKGASGGMNSSGGSSGGGTSGGSTGNS